MITEKVFGRKTPMFIRISGSYHDDRKKNTFPFYYETVHFSVSRWRYGNVNL